MSQALRQMFGLAPRSILFSFKIVQVVLKLDLLDL